MLYKAENCHQEHQKRISDLRSNMKSSLIVLALVAVVAANKIPDFVVPGKCPSVDKKAFFDLQRVSKAFRKEFSLSLNILTCIFLLSVSMNVYILYS